jgi:endoplasmic reticulum-Golgi intermediate compartment protein 3
MIGGGKSLIDNFKKYDLYGKTLESFQVRTASGAAISICSTLLIVVLLFVEIAIYVRVDTQHELYVDTGLDEKLRINFDITFPRLPCAFVSVDAMDVSGNHDLDVEHDVFKKRLDAHGNPVGREVELQTFGDEDVVVPEKRPGCGTCYGAEKMEKQCCNTCAEVQEAYRQRGWAFTNGEEIAQCKREGFSEMMAAQANEGCQMYGHLLVSKAAGNFHFAPGKSFQQHHMHVHDLQPLSSDSYNLTHTINQLSFGHNYPGLVNPLDGVSKRTDDAYASMFQYFVKVVPTVYQSADGQLIKTNQFSVTEHYRPIDKSGGEHGGAGHGLPGVFFMYDLSPIMVHVTEHSKSFGHFLTSVCAIVGGVFTVAGIIDSFVYRGMQRLNKSKK